MLRRALFWCTILRRIDLAAVSLPANILESNILDWILFPILIVEMPPFFRVNRESLFLHDPAQQGAASALVGRAAGEIRIGALRHFIVAAGHGYFLSGFQIV